MFAALGRSAYRRRKLIVVLSLAFAAGIVATLNVAAQLKAAVSPILPLLAGGQRQMRTLSASAG